MFFFNNRIIESLRFYCVKSISLRQNSQNKTKLVPQTPLKSKINFEKLPPRTKITADSIALLERLSLVDCANRQGIEILEDAISLADQIHQVDTSNVEPLITVLEDKPLSVREDLIKEGNCRDQILQNAVVAEEEYFVAPPGNISLDSRNNLLYDDDQQNTDALIETNGILLQENLRAELFNHIVIDNRDIQIFPCGIMPFGLTRFTKRSKTLDQTKMQENTKVDFSNYFECDDIVECWIFRNLSETTHFFHQWQRDRRIWWRKFSAFPGRYILTDIKHYSDNSQKVDILAKYPWGHQLVESLSLVSEIDGVPSTELQIKHNRKISQVQCVVSKIYSTRMVLNTLCDAYDEAAFQNSTRPLLRLHRKLAPYKLGFSISSGAKSVVDELKYLALYLCRQLRKNHVSCLFLPSSYKNTLDSQWKQYDQMGIPYSLVLNENTLKNGVVQLRSRDTTLKEQVHMTDLPCYVEKIFKNY